MSLLPPSISNRRSVSAEDGAGVHREPDQRDACNSTVIADLDTSKTGNELYIAGSMGIRKYTR